VKDYLRGIGLPAIIAIAVTVQGTPAGADSLSELLPRILESHNLVKAAEADLERAEVDVDVTRGSWFPTVSVLGTVGHEKQKKPEGTNDTDFVSREFDLTIKQLLWDFGSVNSQIRSKKLSVEAAENSLELQRQNLMLDAISAYLNVRRAHQVLMFARESENNIIKQTELEDALVRRGAGLSTDVLQAKTQLSGAQARRVLAEGQLAAARNQYRAIFETDVPDLNALKKPKLPLELIPKSVVDAVQISVRENPAIKVVATNAAIAREALNTARAQGLFPTFNAIGESKTKKDVGGTSGLQRELFAKVQMSFDFNLGLSAINTLTVTELSAIAENKRLGEARDQTERQVRDSWDTLMTNKQNYDFRRNQAYIAAEFLELARKERQLGNRSLLDVLAGETNLNNANSDTASAETDLAIGIFTLLRDLGRLRLELIAE
jgi:TolC family type I secretion outer membrane protein